MNLHCCIRELAMQNKICLCVSSFVPAFSESLHKAINSMSIHVVYNQDKRAFELVDSAGRVIKHNPSATFSFISYLYAIFSSRNIDNDNAGIHEIVPLDTNKYHFSMFLRKVLPQTLAYAEESDRQKTKNLETNIITFASSENKDVEAKTKAKETIRQQLNNANDVLAYNDEDSIEEAGAKEIIKRWLENSNDVAAYNEKEENFEVIPSGSKNNAFSNKETDAKATIRQWLNSKNDILAYNEDACVHSIASNTIKDQSFPCSTIVVYVKEENTGTYKVQLYNSHKDAASADIGGNIVFGIALPDVDFLRKLAPFYVTHEMANSLPLISKMLKLASGNSTPSIFVTAFLEFFYNYFVYAPGKEIDINVNELFKNFKVYNLNHCRGPLNILCSHDRFISILKDLCIDIKKNKIQHYQCRETPLNLSLNLFYKIQKLCQPKLRHTNDLRGPCEIPVSNLYKQLPMNMSSNFVNDL